MTCYVGTVYLGAGSFEAVFVPQTGAGARARVRRGSSTERSDESLARTATRLRRRVRLMAGLEGVTMITLTVGGRRVWSVDEALDLIRGYVHYLRRASDRSALVPHAWVAVPEPHADGAYHVHLVVPRTRYSRSDLVRLRAHWTRYLVSRGYEVSAGARYHRVHVMHMPGRVAARYLAKYVVKLMTTQTVRAYERVYCTGRGFVRAVRMSLESFLGFVAAGAGAGGVLERIYVDFLGRYCFFYSGRLLAIDPFPT